MDVDPYGGKRSHDNGNPVRYITTNPSLQCQQEEKEEETFPGTRLEDAT